MSITLTSSAFHDSEAIPQKYSCDGADISPPLQWDEVPAHPGEHTVISSSSMRWMRSWTFKPVPQKRKYSSNLDRLLRLRHQDEDAFFDRLRRAYEWLPMPQRQVKRNWEPLQMILGTLVGIHQAHDIRFPENAQTAVSHPYRTLANAIIHLTYRNGPIENSHAGREAAFPLDHRRFTDRQARQIIRAVEMRQCDG